MFKILEIVLGLFSGGSGTKTAGMFSGLTALGGVLGGFLWLVGPGRDWQVTLNAMELGFVALAASIVMEWIRKLPPPAA